MDRILNFFNYLVSEPKQSILSGLIDIISVIQSDGSIKSMPFHIRFGTLKVIQWKEAVVKIYINGKLQSCEMRLDEFGAAYFTFLVKERKDSTDSKHFKFNQKAPSIGVIQQAKQAQLLEKVSPSHVIRSLRPTSDILESFQLNFGKNDIRFEIDDEFLGHQFLDGRIFLYNNKAKFVISDIDGTVTKSDVLGHLFNLLNKDWFQHDIVDCYKKIIDNGYQMIYLTARPLVQYGYTIRQMDKINQDGMNLPEGPFLLSPDLLLASFKRELIFRIPDQFKGALMKDLRNLFDTQQNPLFAGFGNKDSDAIGGLYAGIDKNNLFTINHKGQIHHLKNPSKTLSYKKLSTYVNKYFPKIHIQQSQQLLSPNINNQQQHISQQQQEQQRKQSNEELVIITGVKKFSINNI